MIFVKGLRSIVDVAHNVLAKNCATLDHAVQAASEATECDQRFWAYGMDTRQEEDMDVEYNHVHER